MKITFESNSDNTTMYIRTRCESGEPQTMGSYIFNGGKQGKYGNDICKNIKELYNVAVHSSSRNETVVNISEKTVDEIETIKTYYKKAFKKLITEYSNLQYEINKIKKKKMFIGYKASTNMW